MAEHQINEKVIGIAMDGTGFGDDGKIWGSEFFVCDLKNYTRVYHLAYLPLPGGEKAVREPWCLALATAFQTLGEEFLDLPLLFHQFTNREKQLAIIKALKKNINIYESCGMGRLFDVVAALLNLVHTSNFDGEGPVKLENIHCKDLGTYPVRILDNEYRYEPVIRGVVNDLLNEVPGGIISGRFHNTISEMICNGAERIAETTGLKKVALSGGLFQNKIITEKVVSRLDREGFAVFTNKKVPCNDGGISLGQLAIATKKIEKQCV
jgi:hydrogenase maturation protein HypF